MKKFILTESQFQMVIDHVLEEKLISEQRYQILRLKNLAELVSRLDPDNLDIKTLLDIFIDVYRDEGDKGVINLFKSATDLDLEDMGHGRYMLK